MGGIIGSVGSYFSGLKDAEVKELEADQKRMEAFADQIRSINDSFKQTLQSAIETTRTILAKYGRNQQTYFSLEKGGDQ